MPAKKRSDRSSSRSAHRRAPLPRLAPKEVRARLGTLLQSLGNLSGYVQINLDGGVVLKSFANQPACATLPVPTLADEAVRDDRLQTAITAIEQLERAEVTGEPMQYSVANADCVIRDGTIDLVRTQQVKSEPPSSVDPPFVPPPPGGDQLPRLSLDQIKEGIATLLRESADVLVYMTADPGNGNSRVQIRRLSRKVVLPPPLQEGDPIPRDRISLLQRAMTQLNEACAGGDPGSAFHVAPRA